MLHPRQSCELRYLVDAASSLFWGNCTTRMDSESLVRDNGSGDFFDVEWDENGAVVLVFNHESPRSQYSVPEADRDPYQHLSALPDVLKPLAERALSNGMVEGLVTAGAWWTAEGWSTSDPWNERFCHGLEQLWGHQLTLRDALFKGFQPWLETASLEAPQGEVLLSALESRVLCGADQAVLAAHPHGDLSDERDDFLEAAAFLGIRLGPGVLAG